MPGNPIFFKELRVMIRQQRTRSIITLYMVIMALITFILYTTIISTNAINPDPDIRRTLGKIIFLEVVFVQFIAIMFILPLFSADSITHERENRTLDLVRITPQSSGSIVRGKLFATFLLALLVLMVGLPLESSAYLLGGITTSELSISTLLLITSSLFLCSLSIWVSSRSGRTSTALGLSYTIATILFLGVPVLGYVIIKLAPISDDQSLYVLLQFISNNLNPILRPIFIVIVWFLIASNPISTAIYSYSLFQSEGVRVSYNLPSMALQFPLPSPWIIFVLFYLIIFGLFYRLAVSQITKRNSL